MAVEAGEPLRLDRALQLLPVLQIGDQPEFLGQPLLGPDAQAVGDVVLGDHQVLIQVVLASDKDVAVRVAGVEVVHRHPVEPRSQVLLHLGHKVAGELAQVPDLFAVLGRDDEAELVAVFPPALHEGVSVRVVGVRAVEPAALAVAGDAVPLQVTDVGVSRLATAPQPHDPGLHHRPAEP